MRYEILSNIFLGERATAEITSIPPRFAQTPIPPIYPNMDVCAASLSIYSANFSTANSHKLQRYGWHLKMASTFLAHRIFLYERVGISKNMIHRRIPILSIQILEVTFMLLNKFLSIFGIILGRWKYEGLLASLSWWIVCRLVLCKSIGKFDELEFKSNGVHELVIFYAEYILPE